jgi:hypothetical protein
MLQKIGLKNICRNAIINAKEPPMSSEQEYTKYLEKLIVKTLLPVYEEHCKNVGADIYSSGIPTNLLKKLHDPKLQPALFLPKKSGRYALDPEPPKGKN